VIKKKKVRGCMFSFSGHTHKMRNLFYECGDIFLSRTVPTGDEILCSSKIIIYSIIIWVKARVRFYSQVRLLCGRQLHNNVLKARISSRAGNIRDCGHGVFKDHAKRFIGRGKLIMLP